jgi:hypothetical protein
MAKKKAAKKSSKKAAKKTVKKAAKKAAKKVAKKVIKKTAKLTKAAPKKVVKKKKPRKVSAKRELIDTGTDKRYVHRRDDGTFKDSVDVSRSLSDDARHDAATDAPAGMGDQGD